MKLGVTSFLILSIFLLGFFVFNFVSPTFAVITPGQGPYTNDTGSLVPVWVNTSGLEGKVDMFFVNGSTVYIVANFSCSVPDGNEACNSSMVADANFTEIGQLDNSGFRKGVYKTNSSTGSWAVFEFNATINLTNVQQIQPKMVRVNASTSNGTTSPPGLMAPVLVVNMSTFGCPPAGQSGMTFPIVPGYNISTGLPITTPLQALACTQNTTLCGYTDIYGPGTFDDVAGQWKVCAPNFGGATTNLSSIAETGNMSAIQGFTIEVLGKGKIVFNTNVSFGSQSGSQAVMEFAMKSLMGGGKIGMNDSEWAGSGGRPNLNLSATLTIYNISQYGIVGKGRPQIFRYPTHNSNVGGTLCPPDICSGFTWDGQNISFTVTSFSDYGLNDSINVTLTGPNLNGTITSPSLPLDASYPANRINFTFTPEWDTGVTMKNCTLYGNFTGASWLANATNQTALVNGNVNGIVNNVTDGHYKWNVYCYDVTGQYDYEAYNSTLIVAIPPIVNNTIPANGSYIQATSSRLFQVNVYDYNLNTSNASLYYKDTGEAVFTRLGLTCYGTAPSFVCNITRDLSAKDTGYEIRYYFEATDNATNYANNGTASNPWITTIDNTEPTYTNWATNVTNATTIRRGIIIGLSARWADNYALDKYLLSRNETGNWVNQTAVAFTAGNWSNVSIDTSAFTNGVMFRAEIFANDSANNQKITTVFQWTIDGTAPQILYNTTNTTNNTQVSNQANIMIMAQWSDNIELNKYWLWHNISGGASGTNASYGSFPTTGNWTNITLPVLSSLSAGTMFRARIFANDTSDNQNSTLVYQWSIDNQAPQVLTNATNSSTGYARGILLYANWTDNVDLGWATKKRTKLELWRI